VRRPPGATGAAINAYLDSLDGNIGNMDIIVSGEEDDQNPQPKDVTLYDTDPPTGADPDLEVNQGNALIVPDSLNPVSDSGEGAIVTYEFNPPRNIESVIFIDLDEGESGEIRATTANGVVVIPLPEIGNNNFMTVAINVPDVTKLEIEYTSSGAHTKIISPCDDSILGGAIRDFNKKGSSNGHPDFQDEISDDDGIVGPLGASLGLDGNPVYQNPTPITTTSAERFNQWYNTVNGVNQCRDYFIPLDQINPNTFEFRDNSYFPIDNELLGNQGLSHNYHFTAELRGTFVYNQGGSQVITITGDDDIFLFINEKLEYDGGGVLPARTTIPPIDLDNLPSGQSLVDGTTYDIDLFFAERHTTQSELVITVDNIIITQTPSQCNGAPGTMPDEAETYKDTLVQIEVLENDYRAEYVTNIPTQPNYGVVTIGDPYDGIIDDTFVIYTPDLGFIGEDIFTYQALYNDGSYSVETLVTVTVLEPSSSTILNIALVCGDSNCSNNSKDVPLLNHLLGLGYNVDTKNDDGPSWNPLDYDIIVISESVLSSNTDWLKDAQVPILTVEGSNSDELEMGDGGSSSGGGSKFISIAQPHPITVGFSGIVEVTTSSNNLGHMTGWNAGSGIKALAYYEDSGDIKAKILAVEKDGMLVDGSEAADKRVFFGAQYFGHLNGNGIQLFNQALDWLSWTGVYTMSYTDTVAPQIQILSENPTQVEINTVYIDAGATATDDVDGEITEIYVINQVDTLTLGIYQVIYSAYDLAGNEASETRNVEVYDPNAGETPLHLALVCKRSNCTDSDKDVPLKNHLESLGHIVDTYNDDNKSWNPAVGYDALVISESVKSDKIAWLKDKVVPILTVEGANSDELSMGDGGSSSSGKSKFIIIDVPSAHYITQGFPANVQIQVTTSVNDLGHMTGYDGYGLQELAHYDTSGAEKAKILVADSGALLVDGSSAADKRVFFGAKYFANLNDNGITLFDRALEWAVIP